MIPSNDAFVANGSPTAHAVFDEGGLFGAMGFSIGGGEVLDAGTEMSDEQPENTAFFGQQTPDTGVTEGGVVMAHPGFLPPGSGGILDDPMFAEADFLSLTEPLASVQFAEGATLGESASGDGHFTLNDDETELRYDIWASGLSTPVIAAHFHQAPAGEAGAILFDLEGTIEETDGLVTIRGVWPLAEGDLEAIRNGEVYVNLHTPVNQPGEIRGQLVLPAEVEG